MESFNKYLNRLAWYVLIATGFTLVANGLTAPNNLSFYIGLTMLGAIGFYIIISWQPKPQARSSNTGSDI